jgi:hypothetical protein
MRKIDKTIIIATEYASWIRKLNNNKKTHPVDQKYSAE